MARHPFGGGAPDWAVSTADGVPVEAVGGAIVKAYSAFLGGTQYTDLSMDQEGTQVVSQIVASDGTDGLMLGQIPQFYGPDGVWEVWLSANNGPRVRAQALDTADLVQGALDSIADVQTTLDQADADHASLGQANGIATLGADGKLASAQRPPSATALASLTDVNLTSPADGDVLVYDGASSKWKNAAPTAWTALTFLNGCSSNASASSPPGFDPAYRIEADGKTVRLRGVCNVGAGVTSGASNPCLTIPHSINPGWMSFTVSGNSGVPTMRADVGWNGADSINIYWLGASKPTWFSLDGITYTI
jgi:hypothetical protein